MRAPPRIRARLAPKSHEYDLDAPYSSLTGRGSTSGRRRGLVGYFKGRKGWWWAWNVIRLCCLVMVVVFMAVLLNNFYKNGGGHCSWCKYLRYGPSFPYLGLSWLVLLVCGQRLTVLVVCRLMGGVIWGIFIRQIALLLHACSFSLINCICGEKGALLLNIFKLYINRSSSSKCTSMRHQNFLLCDLHDTVQWHPPAHHRSLPVVLSSKKLVVSL
jgi:hypothetical protein